jgi:hypothetical protein
LVAGLRGWHHRAYIQLIIAILFLFCFKSLLDYSNVIVDLYVGGRNSQLTDGLSQPVGWVSHYRVAKFFRLGFRLLHRSDRFLIFCFR